MTLTPPLGAKGFEARHALLVYVVVLMAIPSELVVGPLGAAGTPAGIIGVCFMMWWLASVAVTPPSNRRANPVKWLLAVYGAALLTSYVSGMSRPIVTAAEVSSADRYVLGLCGWLGVSLVLIDGIATRERLDTLLKVVAAGAVFIATLGCLQFFFGVDLAHVIRIPGLSANRTFGELQARSTFRRVSGTTSHPIEFGVILSALLPIAIHYARFAERRTVRLRWWLGVIVMAGALPLSVARSGILGAAVALVIMIFTWPRDFRGRILLALAAGMITMSFVVPGLLGTIRGLFLNAGSDPSTHGRTEDYGPVLEYVKEAPLFGRGVGTFIPSLYRTLDNHYLGVLAEAGLVGLVATVALFLGSIVVAQRVRRLTTHPAHRDLAQSLTAAMAVLAVNAATFDMFGFSMCAGLVFLLTGCIGAMSAFSSSPATVPLRRLTAPGAFAIVGATLVVAVAGAGSAMLSPPTYMRYSSVLFQPPDHEALPALANAGRAGTTASLVHDMTESPAIREDLLRKGAPSFDLALGDGSLMRGTDRIGYKGPVLKIVTRSPDGPSADLAMSAVLGELDAQLTQLQDEVKVPASERVRIQVLSSDGPYVVQGRPARALGATGLLCLALLCCSVHVLRRRSPLSRGMAAGRRGHPVVAAHHTGRSSGTNQTGNVMTSAGDVT